ncbi:hypothetical protein ACWCQN_47480 [Streptomyces sp. NPDC001984]|uniref:hypothetical protein n=1 Tax=Streptomyces sp. NPDC002619 TaxID=3364655 RepID=UPI0036904044
MKMTRSTAVTAAVAALAASGLTYASASEPAARAAPAVRQAAPAVQVPLGTDPQGVWGNAFESIWGIWDNGGEDDEGNGGEDDEGNGGSEGNEGNEGRGDGGRGFHEDGRIQINERSFSSHPGDCITVISGLGAKTLNIRNDSRKTVEVFRGAVCDNGAPIATVGPHSQSDGVDPQEVDGIFVKNGVVGSFRVIEDHGHGDWS